MRQPLRICLAGILLMALTTPAAAGEFGFWRWWDSLSGPGPFSGIVVTPTFVCRGIRDGKPGVQTFPDLGCSRADRQKLHLTFGAEIAKLSGRNNLPYESQQPGPDVQAYPLLFTVDASNRPYWEVGVGAGFVVFNGAGFRFARFVLEPSIAVRPLAVHSDNQRLQFLELRVFTTLIAGTISAADFGATGSWKTSNEWQPGVRVTVDVGKLVLGK